MQQHALRLDDPLHRHVLQLVSSHLSQRSVASYNSKLRLFLDFCAEQRLQPFPASPATLMLYIAFLSRSGRVHPNSFAQYLAVVNTAHADMGMARPGAQAPLLNPMIRAAKRQVVTQGVVAAHRAPIPARVAAAALAATCRPGCPPLMLVRIAAFLMAFHTGLRGASILALTADDVTVRPGEYTISIYDEKGRTHEGQRRIITCQCYYPEMVRVVAALCLAAGAGQPLFSRVLGTTDGAFNSNVGAVLSFLNLQPPADEKWLGHSCRSGMASAAFKLGVPLFPTIADRGGWRSDAILRYIFPGVTDDFFGFAFFGFLLPAAARAVAAVVHRPVPLLSL